MLDKFQLDSLVMAAIKEDMPFGDITTDNLVDQASVSHARFIAKDQGVVAGLDVCERVFMLLDDSIVFTRKINDGDHVKYGDVIAEVQGSSRAVLKAERTALNFLQRLSGIATKTDEFCRIVEGLPVKITDTRKTTPGLRMLEKYAVKVGGGSNHRYSLSDGVLIKDNHIKAAGGIKNAIRRVRVNIPHTTKIEVETETLDQVREALDAKADIIMLDNMSIELMAEAVKLIDHRALVEASGNMDKDRLLAVARTGVDIISIGKLTHSVSALDISLRFA